MSARPVPPPPGGNGNGAAPADAGAAPPPGMSPGGPPGPGGAPGMPPGGMPPGMLLPQRRKVVIMIVVMMALFLAALDQTIWNVAAPKAVGDLGRLDLFAWPATSYLLGSTVLVPIIGKMSDIYGRKPFLLAGVVIFLIGSALSGAAGSMWELIGFRLLQGIGAAFIMANAFTVMGDYFAPAERPRWAGIVAGTFALASIIGPLAGGVLTDELSWRWVFYINLPVGGVALIAIMILMPRHRPEDRSGEHVDWSGATLLLIAAAPLLLAFSMGGTQFGWGDSPVVGCLIATVIAAYLFWRVARRKGEQGIMPLPMFQNRTYLLCTIVMLAIGIGMMGAMFSLPFFLQGAQGVSATNSGLVTMPMSIGVVPASVITGQILARTGRYKPIAILGGTGAVVSLFLLSTLQVDSNLNYARGYMLLMGASMGTLMPLYTLLLQNSLPFKLLGAGTATNQFFRQIGAASGVAVFGALMVSGFAGNLNQSFPDRLDTLKETPHILLDPDQLAVFTAQLEQQAPGTSDAVITTAREALAGPVTDVFFYGGAAMLTAVVVAILLPKVSFRSQEEMMAEMRKARMAAGGGPPPGMAPPAQASPPGAPRPMPAAPAFANGGPPAVPASAARMSNGDPDLELVATWARQQRAPAGMR